MAQRFAASPSILNFMASSPNYGKLASVGAMENAKTEAQSLAANAGIHSAALRGMAEKEISKYRGDAAIAQGQAAGRSAMMSGISSGIGSIAGGFMNMPDNSYAGTGSTGINTPGKYGLFQDPTEDIRKSGFVIHGPDYSGFPTTGGFA